MGYGKYNIVLQEGEASKPFDEMSSEDIMKASKEVMAMVEAKSKAYGSKIIGKKSIRRKDLSY